MLFSVTFVSPRQGWAVGDEGTILATTDGGATWQAQRSGTKAWLSSVAFVSPCQGWAAGENGTILTTADGGATWASIHYVRWPAPWFWILGCGIPMLLLFWAYRLQSALRPSEISVSSALVSDRPLDAGEPDPLHFSVIARGLSRFLRHEQTQPPLTIAVTGEWGTGKSSLMNLLKANLSRYGFQALWFNAWHHQKEEHLLAALLDADRSCSGPPWRHPTNWRFRIRLLSLRIGRHLFGLLAVGIVYALIVGYLWNNPELLRAFFQSFPRYERPDDECPFAGGSGPPGS
ncbi:MAG: hypothetical protein D6690_16970 [Nitrospirae bacterium]|nr:MAG: hypothetical protein D6690_16970 [Nitrospirota bacterium]